MTQNSMFEQHWQKAKTLHNSSNFIVVEHGWEQHVLIDSEKNIVYRYPRNPNAKAKLDDEVAVLKTLNTYKFNVDIPIIIKHHTDFTAYKYIPGDVADPNTLASLNSLQLKKLGSDLGEFLSELHSVNKKIVNAKKTKQTTSLYQYYQQRIDSAKHKDFYKHACKLLDDIQKNQTEVVVVHGDLHGLNIVINPDTKNLVGVIDFSELELGNRYQDFRKIFMADERLLEPALETYEEKSGVSLEKKTILSWAYVNEWANIAFFAENPLNPTYIRALNHLKKWGQI